MAEETRGAALRRITPVPGHCLICGRYAGPLETCPYCGEAMPGRLRLRVFRVAAAVIVVAGLLLLYLAAARRHAPLVSIGELRPSMNFGVVRVRGAVESAPRVRHAYGRPDSVSVRLDDGTGRLTVCAYGDTAAALARAGLPERGDRLTAEGTLRLAAGRLPRLQLRRPADLAPAGAETPARAPP